MTVSPQDFFDITQVLGRYAVLIDSGRYDEWVDLFLPDGAFRTPVPPENEIAEFRGHERIREITSWGYQGCHNGGMPVITVDGDRGDVIWPFILMSAIPGQSWETRIGRYEIELTRVDGSWRIADLLVNGGVPIE